MKKKDFNKIMAYVLASSITIGGYMSTLGNILDSIPRRVSAPDKSYGINKLIDENKPNIIKPNFLLPYIGEINLDLIPENNLFYRYGNFQYTDDGRIIEVDSNNNEVPTEETEAVETTLPTEDTTPVETEAVETTLPTEDTTPVETEVMETTVPTEDTTPSETEVIDATLPTEDTIPVETEVIDATMPTEDTIPSETEVIDSTSDNITNDCSGTVIKESDILVGSNEYALKIGKLSINDNVIRILSNNSYDLVRCNDKIGFIKSDSVKYNDINAKVDDFNIKFDVAVTNTKNLHFRNKPSLEGDIIGSFKNNQELEVYGETDEGWLLVRNNDQFGYVYKEYTYSLLDKLKEMYPSLEIDQLVFNKVCYPNSDLNMRLDPSTDSEKIKTLERLESVRVISEDDGWSLVMTNEHQFGYVSSEYLEELTGDFIVIDLSSQKLTTYNNQNGSYCPFFNTPVTTGKDTTPSDKGLFEIWYREEECYITDEVEVDFWMCYNYAMEGIHDAYWRSVYGEEDYHTNGSNGCINTPYDVVSKIYPTTRLGTKVLVHK